MLYSFYDSNLCFVSLMNKGKYIFKLVIFSTNYTTAFLLALLQILETASRFKPLFVVLILVFLSVCLCLIATQFSK